MKKQLFYVLVLLAGTALSNAASATDSEEENVAARAAGHIAHPIRDTRNSQAAQRLRNSHPIHRLKHAHPIRRLEGK